MTSRISAALSTVVASVVGALVATTSSVSPQSTPGLIFGQVPTPAEWNSYFAAKQDFVGGTPLSTSGGRMTGELVFAASSTGNPSFNVPAGVTPTVPVNGDFWYTPTGIFAYVNGVAINLAAASSTLSTTGGTMTGKLNTATPTTVTSMLNLPHGASPSSPVNGDLWTTTSGIFVDVNGVSNNLTVLTSGELPAFGSGNVSFAAAGGAGTIAANAVTKARLATATQNTVVGAATSTAEADLAVPSCSTATSALTWTTNTGFGCNSISGGTASALKHQVFTSSGTFTIPTGTVSGTLFKFTITGGGANGGAASTSSGAGGAGGGGAAGTAINYLSGLTAGNTITVTVGGAGVASSISSGTQTITTVTASTGSAGGAATNSPTIGPGGAAGGGGSTTNAEIAITGGDGLPGNLGNSTSLNNGAGGSGGDSYWGSGGAGGSPGGSAGTAARAFGAGGGGGSAGNGAGAGKAGVVLVEWVL